MKYIAHKREDGTVQSVGEHLKNVAELSRMFAVEDMKELCYTAGLLHDAGKYLYDFQKRINGDSSIHVEHSIVGAKILQEYDSTSCECLLIEATIAGHHSGIPDMGLPIDTADDATLRGRLQRHISDYTGFFLENSIPTLNKKAFEEYLMHNCENVDDLIEKYSFLTRYAFSCLTDADSIDTTKFITGEKIDHLFADFKGCLSKLDKKFLNFVPETNLQKARSEIQSQVYEKVDLSDSFFLLNMPTGSGKTLCSTKFALQRAIKKGKKRIIYVIPYNSIIDQTYEELKNIFGDSAEILRQQSTFSYFDNEDFEEDIRLRSLSACENWNAQIIISTTVQFFESVYGNKRKMLRKLHNYADSVIVFDEIHLMPVDRMQPCLRAVEYIATLLYSDIIFCTATMPNFEELFKKYTSLKIPLVELTDDKSKFNMFDKCTYTFLGSVTDDSIIEKAKRYPSSLIVVNTRLKAKNLYNLTNGKKYHLSTYMTSLDRLRIINTIKTEIKHLEEDYPNFENVPEDRRIIVISTSLIEAGVDLDFFCVFRELTGLDSILQAGGRCNREGKQEKGSVFVFISEEIEKIPDNDIRIEIVKGIISKYDNFACSEAINEYYDRLFSLKKNNIVSHSIVQKMNKKDISRIPFASYDFRMIDSHQLSIFVPEDEISKNLYKNIQKNISINIRSIQKYCCSVAENEFKELLDCGVIHNYGTDVYCLDNDDYYNHETGIITNGIDYYI